MRHTHTLAAFACAILWTPFAEASSGPSVSPPVTAVPEFELSVLAEGLEQPDGLALHPVTRELYVSEESAGRVSVIRNGRPLPVLRSGFQVTAEQTEAPPAILLNRLASPEGIAFGPDGRLYVVEDTPGGRVLAFTADADGQFGRATVVALPQFDIACAWESVSIQQDGRLYLAGSSHEADTGWGSSYVLARDADRDWWVVDAGPLAGFSALALSDEQDILVVGDEAVGGITWWDITRQRELQTLSHDLGAIEGIALLPDGSLVVAQENSLRAGDASRGAALAGGRIVRVDPSTGALTVLAENLGTLESVVCDPVSGRIYATEDSTGRILCLTPRTPFGPRSELLQVARRSGEARRGLSPRQPPEFLQHFMKRAGVELVADGSAPAGRKVDETLRSLTLEELGRRVPLVAGRVKVEAMPGVEDPITDISFINLFPNQMTRGQDGPSPSFCLFAARHRSGRVDRTEFLPGLSARQLSADGAWTNLSRATALMVPLATCSAVETEDGVTVVMTFLGLERFNDCFLTLNYGRRNDAYLATSGRDLRVARATFVETHADGREQVNFAMTGVRPRRVEDATWMPLGANPRWSLLSPSIETWVSRWALTQMPDLVQQMRRYNRTLLDKLLADEAQDTELATRQERKPDTAGPRREERPVSQPQQRSVFKPIATEPPMAWREFQPNRREIEEENILTNLILSRIVQAWEADPVR